jgi:hypothetical protein
MKKCFKPFDKIIFKRVLRDLKIREGGLSVKKNLWKYGGSAAGRDRRAR